MSITSVDDVSSGQHHRHAAAASPPVVELTSCLMAPKTKAGTGQQSLHNIISNVYPIKVPHNFPVFRYDIDIVLHQKGRKPVEMSKGPRDR